MRRQINADELQYLYSRIGKAIWHLQYVESALVPFIIIKGIVKEPNSINKTVALDHERALNKLTLGQLIGKAQQLDVLEEQLQNRLEKFNIERKWLVHNSIRESGDHLYTGKGRDNVFTRIEEFIEEAIALQKSIGELMVEYCVSKGMSERQLEQIAVNQLQRLKGKA